MGKQLKSSRLAGNELVPSTTKNTASEINPIKQFSFKKTKFVLNFLTMFSFSYEELLLLYFYHFKLRPWNLRLIGPF